MTSLNNKTYSIRDYLSVPFIGLMVLLSYLPLWVLYGTSWVLSIILHRIVGYRKNVVRQNLRNAFPEKTEKELQHVERKFYRHFSDVMVEVLKLKTMSPAQLKRRCYYSPASVALLDRYYAEGKSVMIVMGHTGNWEWAGASYPLYNKHQIITAYKPLRNKAFDRYTLHMRKRTGNILASMKKLPREMLAYRSKVTGTALIADQNPNRDSAYWIDFLNQPTAFFRGTELLSKKFNTPVFWGSVRKQKRGYYYIELQLITDTPRSFEKEGSLTALHASYLERDIREQPEAWLWSHRRWKFTMPEGAECIKLGK